MAVDDEWERLYDARQAAAERVNQHLNSLKMVQVRNGITTHREGTPLDDAWRVEFRARLAEYERADREFRAALGVA